MPNPYWTSPETGRTYDTTSDDGHGNWLEATPADLAADAALGGGRHWRTRQQIEDDKDLLVLILGAAVTVSGVLAATGLTAAIAAVLAPFIMAVALTQWPLYWLLIVAVALYCLANPGIRALSGLRPALIALAAVPLWLLQLLSLGARGGWSHLGLGEAPEWMGLYVWVCQLPWTVIVAVAVAVAAVRLKWSRNILIAAAVLAVVSVLLWVGSSMGLISVDQIVSSWALALSLPLVMWIAAERRGSHV